MRKMSSLLALSGLVLLACGLAIAADDEKKDKAKDKGGSAALDKIFEKMADGADHITKEKFTKFFEERFKDKGGKIGDRLAPLMKGMFDKLDTNGDGKLTREEFAKFQDGLGGALKDKGGKLFDRLKDKLKDKFKGRKKADD